MSDSGEESPDRLRSFQPPSKPATVMSFGSESPLDQIPISDKEDNINLSPVNDSEIGKQEKGKDSGGGNAPEILAKSHPPSQSSIELSSGLKSPLDQSPLSHNEDNVNLSRVFTKEASVVSDVKDSDDGKVIQSDSPVKGMSFEKGGKVKQSPDKKRERKKGDDSEIGKQAKGKDSSGGNAPGNLGKSHPPAQSSIELSPGSESPLDQSPLRHNEDNLNLSRLFKKEATVVSDIKDSDDGKVIQSYSHVKGKSLKESGEVKQTPDSKRERKKDDDSEIGKEAKEKDSSGGNAPENLGKSQALVECDGDSIDLSGDGDSVGRVVISEDSSKQLEMFLDLKVSDKEDNINLSRLCKKEATVVSDIKDSDDGKVIQSDSPVKRNSPKETGEVKQTLDRKRKRKKDDDSEIGKQAKGEDSSGGIAPENVGKSQEENSSTEPPPPAKRAKPFASKGLAALNNIDMLTEVLLRLPSQSLIRLKLVHKEWQELISSKYFRRQHTLRGPKPQQSLVVMLDSKSQHGLFYFNPRQMLLIQYDIDMPFVEVVQASNGLVLLSSRREDRFYVLNPSTREFRGISLTDNEDFPNFGAIGLAQKGDHFRIVCIRSEEDSDPDDAYDSDSEPMNYLVEVYDSESSSWKELTLPPFKRLTGYAGVHWNNSIYWRCCTGYCYFDIDKEEMKPLTLPVTETDFPSQGITFHSNFLQESEGHLFYYETITRGYDYEAIEVWERELEGTWLWKHTLICPETVEASLDTADYVFRLLEDGGRLRLLFIQQTSGEVKTYHFADKSYYNLGKLRPEAKVYISSAVLFGETLAGELLSDD